MVRVSSYLLRAPVIKFRKGGGASSTSAAAASPASSPSPGGASAFQAQSQPAATMSTAIHDTELPARYRRQPISEEEIAHINGGGIV